MDISRKLFLWLNLRQGFVDPSHPTYVCKLHKAIYGLKQAPRAWYSELLYYMLSLQFTVSQSDHCLFIYSVSGITLYLVVYDLIITGNNSCAIDSFVAKIGRRFSIKDLGPLSYFLGVQVIRTATGLFLSQRKSVEDIIERASMGGAKPVSTPLATGNNLSLEDSAHMDDPSAYRTVLGSLQYLSLTRPDIAFAVNRLSLPSFIIAPLLIIGLLSNGLFVI
jgi:hypothetical protein